MTDNSLGDLGEDFYEDDFHDEEHHLEEDHHDYENNFGGSNVYSDDNHPENNPYEDDMYHPGAEEEEQQTHDESYQIYDEHQTEEEQNFAEEQQHFENYEEDPPTEEQHYEEKPQEENNQNETNNKDDIDIQHQEDSHFDDFDPYESYESDNQAPQENKAEIVQESHQTSPQEIEQRQDYQEIIQTLTDSGSIEKEQKSTNREKPQSASASQNVEKKKSSRPSSTEKKKQFSTVEEYVYKPYYENRKKFYDENEIREYMKEKRRKDNEKLKMKPSRNNNVRKKPYDEEKVKEFMKQKQSSDRKLAEQKKQAEIQKKICKKDALKRLDQYIHELFSNPSPHEEEQKPKKTKPEMPQFLKDQVEGNMDESGSRKRIKEFGKKVRSKLAIDHEKKKKLKAVAEELAREMRRRKLHKIKPDSPPDVFNSDESTNSSVWSLWSAPPKTADNDQLAELLKEKTDTRDFSIPKPKHVDCTFTDISNNEPKLDEAEVERRKIIDQALQLISSARKAKEETTEPPFKQPQNKDSIDTNSIGSFSEKPLSNRILPQFLERMSKNSPEKKHAPDSTSSPLTPSVEKPEMNLSKKTITEQNNEDKSDTPNLNESCSETMVSSPSIEHSEYSVKSDRSSLYPFTSLLKKAESESSSLDNSNLDTIVFTVSSKERYFNPIEYEGHHSQKSKNDTINSTSEETNSESSIIVDSSSEHSLDDTEDLHEFVSFNPSTAIFNELIREDVVQGSFSNNKEKRRNQNLNSYSVVNETEVPSPLFVSSSSEIERKPNFSKNQVVSDAETSQETEKEKTKETQSKRKEKNAPSVTKEMKKIKPNVKQSISSVSSLKNSSDFGRELKHRSRPTSNETSSVSSDFSTPSSLISIEQDSETSALLEEVRKKKEEIKKHVFMNLKNSSSEKLKSSYKRNKAKIVSNEVDPFNIISTIKAKKHSDFERERRFKKDKIKKEIKQYKECRPAGLDIVSATLNPNKVSCQTQTDNEKSKSIEIQTSTPVEIIYDSGDESIMDYQDEHCKQEEFHNMKPDYNCNRYQQPVFVGPDMDRLSPDELVEKLLDSLQVYEKVFESDVRLTRLLASSANRPYV